MNKSGYISTEEQSYFYAFPPFPVPANTKVQSRIYWDSSSDIDYGLIAVHDILGTKVCGREKITIDKLNAYSGYLTWDCSGFPTGIYIIQINHGTRKTAIKVVVGEVSS